MTEPHLQEALDYLYSFIDYEQEPRPRDAVYYDLRRIYELLERLGNPHLKARTVHIAGSKGKGSVAAMIASVLTAAGYRTGLYTSPHLVSYNERISIDGIKITDKEIIAQTDKLRPEVAAVNRRAAYGELTTFELITAMGFADFAEKKVDFQVIEVGLGGRLDATNVMEPEVSVITSISLDHTEVLGDTLREIAAEKAGIIKSGGLVVSAPQVGEVAEVIERVCADKKATLIKVGEDVTWEPLGFDSRGQSLRVRGKLGEYELGVPLLGEHQLENAAVAVAVLEALEDKGFSIPPESIVAGLARVKWPGRLEVLGVNPELVVDGAHSPDSARRLREALSRHFRYERAILVFGVSWDKDIPGIISELLPVFSEVVVVRSYHPRAVATRDIMAEFERQGASVRSADNIGAAITLASELADKEGLVCVTGSLFVVGEAIEEMDKRTKSELI